MTVAFVHGNPETSAIWGRLIAELAARGVDDIVTLSPPGFGVPVPDGFGATQDEYRDWLVAELTALGGDVDLVGHDWGAGHVLGAVAARPDLVRTFATDCAGLVHPDYQWHDMAQAWQTPDVGEQVVAAMGAGTVEERTATYVGLGIDEAAAADMAAAFDDVMADAILRLYRSAAQPAMAELGERVRRTELPPGLFVVATEDHYAGDTTAAHEVAASLGASTVEVELGHWWMFAGAATAADALVAHWASV
ncbi:MAG: alpha/beta fold hydrolase [Acidimicrobiales bacterium]